MVLVPRTIRESFWRSDRLPLSDSFRNASHLECRWHAAGQVLEGARVDGWPSASTAVLQRPAIVSGTMEARSR